MHHAGASAQIGSGHGAHRELLDCWPGCSRASWIEGGPDLNGSGSGSSGGGGTAMSAAALAEPPAEPAAAEPPDEAGANTVIRVSRCASGTRLGPCKWAKAASRVAALDGMSYACGDQDSDCVSKPRVAPLTRRSVWRVNQCGGISCI